MAGRAVVDPWQRDAGSSPIHWHGDLDDDCTAEWAGLTLRAEEMQRGNWWWAVYDDRTKESLVDSHAVGSARNGRDARAAAERAARSWLRHANVPGIADDSNISGLTPQPLRVGRELGKSRDLFVLHAPDPAGVPAACSSLPSPFVCLLAWDAGRASVPEMALLARGLIDAGCCYVCCWGPRCETVHDIFDEVDVDAGRNGPTVVTTWHATEPLSDAIWFALFSTQPADGFGQCPTVVGVSIANPAWFDEIQSALVDPSAFAARLSERV